jgi:predicted AlkP superfamily pyrophosphatase or phosphodiesterase
MVHSALCKVSVVIALALMLTVSNMPVSTQPAVQRVLVISLDGGRPDAILQTDTPNIHQLAEQGAVDWQAQTIFPPATLPGHASMLTGLSVEQHGLSHNDSIYPCPVLEAPTFLTLAQQAEFHAAMVVGKGQMCQFHQSDAVDYFFERSGDRSVADRALELLADDYQVIFLHFPNPDYFGHLKGWMSEAYLYELQNTDFQIGRLLAALDEHTLVILTADHGGHGMAHGSDIPEDMTIPFIIAGPGVKPGTHLQGIEITDTAATVLWALGIPMPDDLTGRPVIEAFESAPD